MRSLRQSATWSTLAPAPSWRQGTMALLACVAVVALALGHAPTAAAESTAPGPEPKVSLVVKPGTRLADVRLPCPRGTRQFGGAGTEIADATYCVKWPLERGAIPVKHGPGAWFHPGGGMAAQGPYRDGRRHGVWVSWDEEGRRTSVISYAAGEYDGPYVTWWPNGIRQSEIEWKAGKKHGRARSWGDDGKPLVVTYYDQDRVVRRTIYGADGKPLP